MGYICPPWLEREYPRFLDLWDFLQKGLEDMDGLYLPTLVRKRVTDVSSVLRFSPEGLYLPTLVAKRVPEVS